MHESGDDVGSELMRVEMTMVHEIERKVEAPAEAELRSPTQEETLAARRGHSVTSSCGSVALRTSPS